jgi:hypothetical protein
LAALTIKKISFLQKEILLQYQLASGYLCNGEKEGSCKKINVKINKSKKKILKSKTLQKES